MWQLKIVEMFTISCKLLRDSSLAMEFAVADSVTLQPKHVQNCNKPVPFWGAYFYFGADEVKSW